jgi:hypothetical protein
LVKKKGTANIQPEEIKSIRPTKGCAGDGWIRNYEI